MAFKETNLHENTTDPFDMISKEWMLVTAGDERKINTMTASWGGMGVIWGKDAATVYIRQNRYTKEFVDAQETFSMSFFGDAHRDALALCGKVSGRDCDKIAEAGLTPVMLDGTPAFQEARLVLVCRKAYAAFMDPKDFVDPEVKERWYADQNWHTLYIGYIEKAYVQE